MKANKPNNDLGAPSFTSFQDYLPFAFVCLIALVLFVRHLLVFDQGLNFIADQVTIDDTYYYLNTAWNQRHLGFTTFDGFNQTNGVQFLWYWILVAFSYFFETPESFMYGSLVLCAILSVITILLGYRLGRVLEMGPTKSIIPAVAIAGLVGYNKTLIVGLENTLHLVIFLLLTIEYCRFLMKVSDSNLSSRYYLRITFLLGMITWARLDNAPISALLFAHSTFEFYRINRTRPKFYLQRILLSSAIIGASAFILFYVFYLMGGSIIPVSGLWKARLPEEKNVVAVFVEAWQDGLQRVFPLEHIISERLRELLSLFLTSVFIIILTIRYRFADHKKPLLRGLFILLFSIGFHELMMVYQLPYLAIQRGFWYLAPEYVLMVIMVSLLILWLPELLTKNANLKKQLVVAAAFMFILNTMVFTIYTNKMYLSDKSHDRFHSQRIQAAFWLKNKFPRETRFGSLNSGELGFFSQRSVTNLDGLINSHDYFKFRKNGGGIAEFCKLQGINYFVDYMIPEDIKQNSKLVDTFMSKPTIQLLKLTNSVP